jgi:hypothetical protein
MHYALVYQCGFANVFKGRDRVLQHSFLICEWFCRGLKEAGNTVEVYHCDKAGDISEAPWSFGAGDMFSESKYKV